MKKLWLLASAFFLAVLGLRVLLDTLYAAWPLLLVVGVLVGLVYLAIFRKLPFQ